MAAILPFLDHLTYKDYDNVYEPSEDTFLLCDAINQDVGDIIASNPFFVLEVGSGSGCVITYAVKTLRQNGVCSYAMATDINPTAALTTTRTALHNNVR